MFSHLTLNLRASSSGLLCALVILVFSPVLKTSYVINGVINDNNDIVIIQRTAY